VAVTRIEQKRKPSADWFDILFVASSLLAEGLQKIRQLKLAGRYLTYLCVA
jgi:hypothetical protein